jgi:hypothetical protein
MGRRRFRTVSSLVTLFEIELSHGWPLPTRTPRQTHDNMCMCASAWLPAGVDGRPLPYPTTNISFTFAGKAFVAHCSAVYTCTLAVYSDTCVGAPYIKFIPAWLYGLLVACTPVICCITAQPPQHSLGFGGKEPLPNCAVLCR